MKNIVYIVADFICNAPIERCIGIHCQLDNILSDQQTRYIMFSDLSLPPLHYSNASIDGAQSVASI